MIVVRHDCIYSNVSVGQRGRGEDWKNWVNCESPLSAVKCNQVSGANIALTAIQTHSRRHHQLCYANNNDRFVSMVMQKVSLKTPARGWLHLPWHQTVSCILS